MSCTLFQHIEVLVFTPGRDYIVPNAKSAKLQDVVLDHPVIHIKLLKPNILIFIRFPLRFLVTDPLFKGTEEKQFSIGNPLSSQLQRLSLSTKYPVCKVHFFPNALICLPQIFPAEKWGIFETRPGYPASLVFASSPRFVDFISDVRSVQKNR